MTTYNRMTASEYNKMTASELLARRYPNIEDLTCAIQEPWAIGRDFIQSFNDTHGTNFSCAEAFIKAGGEAEKALKNMLIEDLTAIAEKSAAPDLTADM